MSSNLSAVATALSTITNKDSMEKFLSEILTDSELDALSLRWELMKQLKDGNTQRAIASDLHISLCKVTRGNKIIKDKNSITNKIMDMES
jgi:TrpR family trp operon transcriptional repressor